MMNFPDAPTVGQTYSLYKWDGEKWTCQADPIPLGDSPSDTNPLMNGVVLSGLLYKYSRGDHRHPTDNTRALLNNESLLGTATAATASISGNVVITGTFFSTSKGHYLGVASGNGLAPVNTEANILLYDDGSGVNWCGMGTDVSGRFWIRTGTSGAPGPAMIIDQPRNIQFLKTPYSASPAAGANDTQAATTNFVLSNPATGPFLPLSGGTVTTTIMYINGDMRTARVAPTNTNEGVLYLNNTGTRYLHYTANDQYHLVSGHAYSAAGRLWGGNDFGWPIVNSRLVYVGDERVPSRQAAISESFAGSCITGSSGIGSGTTGVLSRYRQFQIQLAGTWYAVAYV